MICTQFHGLAVPQVKETKLVPLQLKKKHAIAPPPPWPLSSPGKTLTGDTNSSTTKGCITVESDETGWQTTGQNGNYSSEKMSHVKNVPV